MCVDYLLFFCVFLMQLMWGVGGSVARCVSRSPALNQSIFVIFSMGSCQSNPYGSIIL